MAISGPVVLDFDVLEPVTMTIIASLGLSDINLAAIFNLLPVTNLVLPVGMHFQRKQGKIRIPPELNRPGEIMSMRWSGNVRGIVRSEKARSFPPAGRVLLCILQHQASYFLRTDKEEFLRLVFH